MNEIVIKAKKLHEDAVLPTKSHFTDAGWDLWALEDAQIGPEPVKIKTGVAVSIPKGYVGLIWDRSRLGSKGLKVHGGVIDSGYVGEIMVCLCLSQKQSEDGDWGYPKGPDIRYHRIKKGDRIAQMLIQEIPLHVTFEETDELSETERGDGGFGSTGN